MRRLHAALVFLFVLSGLSALVVEQVFERLLLTVVGSATHSASLVLGAFFGGLALGAYLYQWLRKYVTNTLALFVVLELCVASSGIALGLLSSTAQSASAALVRASGDSSLGGLVARSMVALTWMTIPTVAMGATYPALLELVERFAPGNFPRRPLVFYGANLLGALLATCLGPYLLFPYWGPVVTMQLIASCQFCSAILLWATLRKRGGQASRVPTTRSTSARTPLSSRERELIALAWISGLIFFTLEVVWFHLIGATIGMSTYAFATMLTLVLASLFAGSLFVGLLPNRPRLGEWLLPFVFIALAFFLTLSLRDWPSAPLVLYDEGLLLRDFHEGEWLRLRVAAGRIVLPALFAGMIYPLLFRTSAFIASDRPRLAALIGATNALGSLLGSWLTSLWLLDRFGAEKTLFGVVLASLALAGCSFIVWLRPRSLSLPARWKLAPGMALGFTACATIALLALRTPWDRLELTSGYHVYFKRHHVFSNSRLIHFREDGASGFTTVVGFEHNGRMVKTLLTNGKFQGNDSGEVAAQIALALLPILATPERRDALVIGYGTGQSAKVITDAGFQHVDVAEISASIVEAARAEFSHLGGRTVERPTVRLYLEDGRQHLLRTRKQYDLISMEISSIWFSGATNLYSQGFYQVARERLRAKGVLQQWVQLHHITEDEVLSVLKTLRTVFSEVHLYYVGDQGIILASEATLPTTDDFEHIEVHVSEALDFDLKILETAEKGLRKPWNGLILDTEDVARLTAPQRIPINTDENRYLEYATPRHALSRTLYPEYLVRGFLAQLPMEKRAPRERALFGEKATN